MILKKYILIILFLLSSTGLYAEVYYCSETFSRGLDGDRKDIEFTLEKYTIKIDWLNKKIISEDLEYSIDSTTCYSTILFDDSKYITCSDEYGYSFAFNETTREFVFSRAFLHADKSYDQSIALGYGKCSKF